MYSVCTCVCVYIYIHVDVFMYRSSIYLSIYLPIYLPMCSLVYVVRKLHFAASRLPQQVALGKPGRAVVDVSVAASQARGLPRGQVYGCRIVEKKYAYIRYMCKSYNYSDVLGGAGFLLQKVLDNFPAVSVWTPDEAQARQFNMFLSALELAMS